MNFVLSFKSKSSSKKIRSFNWFLGICILVSGSQSWAGVCSGLSTSDGHQAGSPGDRRSYNSCFVAGAKCYHDRTSHRNAAGNTSHRLNCNEYPNSACFGRKTKEDCTAYSYDQSNPAWCVWAKVNAGDSASCLTRSVVNSNTGLIVVR